MEQENNVNKDIKETEVTDQNDAPVDSPDFEPVEDYELTGSFEFVKNEDINSGQEPQQIEEIKPIEEVHVDPIENEQADVLQQVNEPQPTQEVQETQPITENIVVEEPHIEQVENIQPEIIEPVEQPQVVEQIEEAQQVTNEPTEEVQNETIEQVQEAQPVEQNETVEKIEEIQEAQPVEQNETVEKIEEIQPVEQVQTVEEVKPIEEPIKQEAHEELKPSNNKETKKSKKKKSNRPKAKKSTFVWSIIVSIVLFICLVGVAGAGALTIVLCSDKPELNVSDLVSPDSSTIYDSEGNKIMQLGTYLRENISYDEMPNCLIDAFLAVEDSRFFEHIGFDVPRFTKAILENIKSGDFSQGGSTVTMQLVKNSYFSIDAGENSTVASREGMSGIKRKVQEILLSLQLELFTDTTKQDILAMYINKVNYGNNIRGIEKAAEYYFGKSAKDLNVGESAFLAGIINSPNLYNPYNELYKYDSIYLSPDVDYIKNATDRRNEVLNLMVQHGYISSDEANLWKSVNIIDMLAGVSNDFGSTNEKYQWYIDAVIDEVEEMTGESPYDVGMDIYTNMNPYMQAYLYDVQNEEEYTGIEFPNELCQSAVVLMDNQTGAVEALGGGRGEIDSARKFNRATSAYLNPGSSMKPVIDYSLAFEYLGWATSHTITDMPYYLYDGPILISNYDHTYHGDMLMTEALGRSQNTPAVQTLVAVVDKIGEDKVVDYLNSIGFKFDYEDFDLQFAIGGNRCLVTPEQLAGAHAIFMNGGKYIKPHTINYIVYTSGDRENYVADTEGTQVLSEETAWLTAYLERYNMDGPYSSLMWYCRRDYPLYGKTGTTDWADSGKEYGIPTGATKDSWLVMQTNRYTISCWTGYDELQEGSYFSNAEYQENTKSKIVSALLDQLEEHASYKDYDPSIEMEKPEGIVTISHVKGSYPYAVSGGEMVTGYTTKKALEETPQCSLAESMAYSQSQTKLCHIGVSNLTGYYDGNVVTVNFSMDGKEGGMISGEDCDLSSSNVLGEITEARGNIWFPHWNLVYEGNAAPPYNYRIQLDADTVIVRGSTDGMSFAAEVPGYSKVTACVWPTGGGETCIDIPIS